MQNPKASMLPAAFLLQQPCPSAKFCWLQGSYSAPCLAVWVVEQLAVQLMWRVCHLVLLQGLLLGLVSLVGLQLVPCQLQGTGQHSLTW